MNVTTPSKKWTKKDIKSLCSQIDSFWLFKRDHYSPDSLRAAIDVHRVGIVTGGLRGFQSMSRERGLQERQTVEHAKKSGVHGTGTEVIVERFTKLAEDSEKDVAKIDQLVARIEAEGLPPEVLAYLPEALRPTPPKPEPVVPGCSWAKQTPHAPCRHCAACRAAGYLPNR